MLSLIGGLCLVMGSFLIIGLGPSASAIAPLVLLAAGVTALMVALSITSRHMH